MWGWVGLGAFALIATAAHAEPSLRRATVIAQAERVADWQLAHLTDLSRIRKVAPDTRDPRGWQQGSFYVALTTLADRSGAPRYRDAVLAHGRSTGWRLGDRPYHADDHLVGSAYLWAARHGAGEAALAGVRDGLDFVISHPSHAALTFAG